ncbi:CvpA family protein [Paralcaligenes ureilyticus]|uniref:Membrane protein required for colicin V production n=1 Tax=Paralcaligenes ureilyticus TaxID=627131 RepID=A0A4R3LQ42_9BURK|nr:CvpA family protein [Paralcaligenes ureilyticus]TCT00635.1 membrane protein required for colicin V production [Paralcaligenes ureilyticus]
MTSFDYIVLATLGVSAFLGLLRGLVKEILSLIAYMVAFVAAIWWGPRVTGWVAAYIDNGLLRTAAAYAAVFIVVLLLVGLVNVTLGTLIRKTGLTPADHGLGALFGLLRGLLIVLILVAAAGYTELPKEPWWRDAQLSHAAVRGVQEVKLLLPPSLASWLPY